MMNGKKVWLVTGCSKGLGKALVEELIAQGYPVIGTSRSKGSLAGKGFSCRLP